MKNNKSSSNDNRLKTAKIVNINDVDYAVNLEWRTKNKIASSVKKRKKLMKQELPSKNHFDACAFYISDEYFQLGYGNSNDVPLKTKSLATILMEAKKETDNWVALFKIDIDEYYLIHVYEGAVISDDSGGEELIAEAKDIKKRYDISDDRYLIYEDIKNSHHDLMEFIKIGQKKGSKITAIDFNLSGIPVYVYFIIIVVLSSSIGGWFYYDHVQTIKQEQMEKERRSKFKRTLEEQEKKAQKELKQKQEELIEVKETLSGKYTNLFENAQEGKEEPWNQMLKPSQVIEACVNSMGNLSLSKSTWVLQNIVCDGQSVISIYKRGNIVDVGTFLREYPDANIDSSGETATFNEAINLNAKNYNTDIPETQEQFRRAKYYLIGSMQGRNNISYTFGDPLFDNNNYTNPYADINSYPEDTENLIDNTKNIKEMSLEEVNNLLEKSPSIQQIENFTVRDLPNDYLQKLQKFYEKDWTYQVLNLSTGVTINWLGPLLDNISGMRVKSISASITDEGQVEWTVNAPMYLKIDALN